MINILIGTLLELLAAERDRSVGHADTTHVQEAKKRFSQALHEMIDHRVQVAFEERRKTQSLERISVADSLNTSVKAAASSIRSISALHSAPPPPEDVTDTDAMQRWKSEYEIWYETKRKFGMTIE